MKVLFHVLYLVYLKLSFKPIFYTKLEPLFYRYLKFGFLLPKVLIIFYVTLEQESYDDKVFIKCKLNAVPTKTRFLIPGQYCDGGGALQKVRRQRLRVTQRLKRCVHVTGVAHVLEAHQTC